MILDKPLSVGHFGEGKMACAIYSVHVHPDGSRLATGGSDHRVRIWSMEPFRSPAAAVAVAAPSADEHPHPAENVRLLANLSQHSGSVLCVRWSHGGRYLASASDDKYLIIWELLPVGMAGGAAPFGSQEKEAPNVENWSRVYILRGHVMDVLDCDWSPDDSMLVSGSIDNKVIVWRLPTDSTSTAKFLNPSQMLEQHTSFVKGVAWDPIGRFVASIDADNRLLVWRVGRVTIGTDWDVEATISKPFEDCDDTLVRRLSWSADGQFLVATNSRDRDTHNAVVLKRGQWHDKPTFLVGFSQCTLTASFSPKIYKSTAAAAGSRPAHHVVAVAGQDNVITLWLTAAARPFLILKEVFQKPPSDLSWGGDGYTLVVSGYDGTVVVMRFTPEELGAVLPEADREAHLVKIYGTDPTDVALAMEGAPSLVDNPRQLALERERKEQHKKQAVATVQANRGAGVGRISIPPPGPPAAMARHLQIESRGKSGKRRIQPMLMSSGGGGGATTQALTVATHAHVPPGGTVSEGFGTASTTAASAVGSPRSGSKRPRAGGVGGGSGSGQQVAVGTRSLEGTVVRLKSARGIPVVSPPELMPRKGAAGSLVRQITGRAGEFGDAFRASPRVRKAPAATVSSRDGGLGLGSGSGHGGDSGGDGGAAGEIGAAVMECSALEEDFQGLPARRYTLVTVARGAREVWRDYVAGMATACCGNDRIAAVGAEDGSVYIYDRNGVRSAPPLVISPPVAYLECSSDQRPSSPRDSPAAGAAPQSGEHLMAISGDGDVSVWNLSSMRLAVKTSLGPLFRSVSSCSVSPRSSAAPATTPSGGPGPPGASPSGRDVGGASGARTKGVSVARAGVTPEGMPLVLLACQGAFGGSLQAFTFHVGLGTWVRVADGRFALSDFYSSGPCTAPSARAGVLSALQTGVRAGSSPTPSALLQASKAGARPAAAAGAAAAAEAGGALAGGAARESLQSAVTRGHLEDSLSTAVLLGSTDEFLDVLRAYAGHLAKSAGFGHGRIRALCDKLLLASRVVGNGEGGSHSKAAAAREAQASGTGSGQGQLPGFRLCDGPSVLGLDKLYILKEVVLPALSVNRSLQRLVSEYYDTIDLASDRVPQFDRGSQETPATAISILPPAESTGGVVVGNGSGGVCAVGSDGNGDGDVVDTDPPRHAGGADSGPTPANGRSSSSTVAAPKSGTPSGELAAAVNGGTSAANGGGGVGAASDVGAGPSKGKGGINTTQVDSDIQGRSQGPKTTTNIAIAERRAAPGSSAEGGGGASSGGVDTVTMAAGAVSVEGSARTLSGDQHRNGGMG